MRGAKLLRICKLADCPARRWVCYNRPTPIPFVGTEGDPMPDNPTPDPNEALSRIVASAQRLGVELDEADALQWLTAMAARDADQDVVVDIESGTFGHQVAMLDFNPAQLARFREIGRLVELPDRPGVVETALALSGSAAQSKVQA